MHQQRIHSQPLAQEPLSLADPPYVSGSEWAVSRALRFFPIPLLMRSITMLPLQDLPQTETRTGPLGSRGFLKSHHPGGGVLHSRSSILNWNIQLQVQSESLKTGYYAMPRSTGLAVRLGTVTGSCRRVRWSQEGLTPSPWSHKNTGW